MKKILIVLVAAFMVVSANAQVAVGGQVGISSAKVSGGDSETYYSFKPDVSYAFADDFAVGLAFGWSKGKVIMDEVETMDHTFEINPYLRYTFLHGKLVDVFVDTTVGYKHYNESHANGYFAGFQPGVSLKLDKFTLDAHVGFVGWNEYKVKHGSKVTEWGANFNGSNVSLGLYYNF